MKIIKAWVKLDNTDATPIFLASISKGEPVKLKRSLMRAPWDPLPTEKEYNDQTLRAWKSVLNQCRIEDSEGFTYKWGEFELMLRTHPHGFEVIHYQQEKDNGEKKTETKH